MERAQMSFANKQPPKKKRKSRTAFTNHQIFELEKRFLYQKYLSPADRDEIAAQLGLSNAQVRPGGVRQECWRWMVSLLFSHNYVVRPNNTSLVTNQSRRSTQLRSGGAAQLLFWYSVDTSRLTLTLLIIFTELNTVQTVVWQDDTSLILSLSGFRWYENSTSRPSDLQTEDN